MFSEKDMKDRIQVRDSRRKWQKECGLVECRRCGGSKVKVAEFQQTIEIGCTYVKVKNEFCWWCNDDGMVDPWCELMGKRWSDYVHKMYKGI